MPANVHVSGALCSMPANVHERGALCSMSANVHVRGALCSMSANVHVRGALCPMPANVHVHTHMMCYDIVCTVPCYNAANSPRKTVWSVQYMKRGVNVRVQFVL